MNRYVERLKRRIEALPPFLKWLGRFTLSTLVMAIIYLATKSTLLASVSGGAIYFSYILKKQPNEV